MSRYIIWEMNSTEDLTVDGKAVATWSANNNAGTVESYAEGFARKNPGKTYVVFKATKQVTQPIVPGPLWKEL